VLIIIPAIAIIHNPTEIKIPAYTFLVNLNSLLIAGLISLVKRELTQNDAIFVFVAAISPASLYIWAISLRTIFDKLPDRMVPGLSTKREQVVLVVLSFVPFVLWIILMGLTFSPTQSFEYSQPACNVPYKGEKLMSLFWAALFVGCFALGGVLIGGQSLVFPRRQRQEVSDHQK
jgi:hypothetical protein